MRDGVQQRTGVRTWGNISHFGVDSTFLSTVFFRFLAHTQSKASRAWGCVFHSSPSFQGAFRAHIFF